MTPTLTNERNGRAMHLPFGEKRDGPLFNQHILSVKQFSHADLDQIFAVADEMRMMVERIGSFDLLKGKVLAVLFYEPSTRTSSSFIAAIQRLGGSIRAESTRGKGACFTVTLPNADRAAEAS